MISFITNHIVFFFVNAAINAARSGSVLFGPEHIEDPSDKIIGVQLVQCCTQGTRHHLSLLGGDIWPPGPGTWTHQQHQATCWLYQQQGGVSHGSEGVCSCWAPELPSRSGRGFGRRCC